MYEFHKIHPDADRSGALRRRSRGCVHRRSRRRCRAITFSFTPNQPRFSVEQIADVFAELMTEVLGLPALRGAGRRLGRFVTSRLGYAYPERLAGIHINLLSLRRDTALPENPTAEEKRYFEEQAHWMKGRNGLHLDPGHLNPRTLAYGLTDSPVGLAAWIVEKFHTWSDHRGDLDGNIGRDDMLTNIMLYWVTGAIGSSFWPYYARMHGPWPIPDGARIGVPDGLRGVFRRILRPPRSLAEKDV